MKVANSTEPTHGFQVGGGELVNVHDQAKCAGRPCVVHNPSNHNMREWPLNWRGDHGLMERICQHGTGHSDPDDLAYHVSQGREWMGVHGCCGCCSGQRL